MRRHARHKRAARSNPWLLAIVALFWGLQLQLTYMMTALAFRLTDHRDFWLGPTDVGLSYFHLNVVIGAALGLLSVVQLAFALRKPRRWSNVAGLFLVCSFVAGSLFWLRFLRTHELDAQWYQQVSAQHGFTHSKMHYGLILDGPPPTGHDGQVWVRLASCENIRVSAAPTEDPSRLVAVSEMRDHRSAAVRFEVAEFIPYEDLCGVLMDFADRRKAYCFEDVCPGISIVHPPLRR